MAIETVSSTTAGITLGAGTIALTGSIFGVQYDALLAGFFGGLCYLTYSPVAPARLRIATTLTAASLMAGYFSPLLSLGLLHYLPWLHQASDTALRLATAAWIGLAGQSAGPVILNRLNKLIKG